MGRLLMEQMDYNLLFRWFVGLSIDEPVWDASTFNQTHASTTDRDARLYKKGKGKEAKLSFIGHLLMENRNGLIVMPD